MEKQINLWLRKKSNGMWVVNGFVHNYDTQEVIVGANVLLDDKAPAQTNERGFFLFDEIRAGQHVISVQKEGYEDTGDPNKPSRVEFVI